MAIPTRTFGPLVEVCKANGIGRSVAFELASKGVLETFKIGNKRYVTLSSIESLPQRLASRNQEAA